MQSGVSRNLVQAMVQRVVAWTDQLEQMQLPGQDAPLEAFRGELIKEGVRGK